MDPTAMLAVSMQAMPGVYALLLGSGVSRSASVRTGYEVTLDLIERIAASKGQACVPEPETWYEQTFNEPAGYSGVLRRIAPRAAERSAILRGYFEPTEPERAAGVKVPTRAHQAIAQLVAQGYVRVILTTNFDRLLEEALEEQAIRPVVISTQDAVIGATPPQHNVCTIVKVHGDYLDPNIKNTEDELAEYTPPLNSLLDRILDEWGLIVCGWSAQWDIALRAALERCKNQRYTTYWAVYGDLSPTERKLIALRRAVSVPIASADAFFDDVERNVRGVAERTTSGIAAGASTLTPQATFAEAERLVQGDENRPRLRRLVSQQAAALGEAIGDDQFPVSQPPAPAPTPSAVSERMKTYERLSTNVVALMVVCGYYGELKEHRDMMRSALRQVADRPLVSGLTTYISLRQYPALLMLYAGGISAVAGEHYDTLWRLLSAPVPNRGADEDTAAVVALQPHGVVDFATARDLPTQETPRLFTPMSEHLFKWLRAPLADVLIAAAEYEQAFDRYEYLAAMVSFDLTRERFRSYGHAGRFGWKARIPGRDQVMGAVERELATEGADLPLLRAGAFDGDLTRALEAQSALIAMVRNLGWF